jgi:hypothetical protein
MKQLAWRSIFAALVVAAVCGIALADGNAPAATAKPAAAAPAVSTGTNPYGTSAEGTSGDFEKWCESVKKPCEWFRWGADFQFRNVYSNNTTTLNKNSTVASGPHAGEQNHEAEYSRYRGRIWTTIQPADNVEVNARFQWEAFNNYEPEYTEGTTLSQGLLDQLNVKFKDLASTKSVLTAGRQDIFFGDGWLVADGTPFDGSLTGFFDAIRYQYDFEDSINTADVMYIWNHSNPAQWLHPVDSVPFPNAEQDESGTVVSLTNKSIENTELTPYFIYKRAEAVNYNFNGAHPNNGYNGELYTPGIRATHKIDENWKVRGEGAYQFGYSNKPNVDGSNSGVSAFGANGAVQYFTHDTLNNNFRVQYEFLSGDRPGTNQYEGFDVLWGRWARFSDAYADMTVMEQNGRKADYSNMHRIGPGWSFNPSDKFELATDYYLMFADQSANVDAPGMNAQGFSDNGMFRGQLLTSVLSYKFNKNISGHLQGELFFPGNYYSNNRNDVASFLRYQLVLTF